MQQDKANEFIDAVKNRYSDNLRSIPGVIGVGVGTGHDGPVIQIHITDEDPVLPNRLPKQLEGVPIEVITHPGGFRAF